MVLSTRFERASTRPSTWRLCHLGYESVELRDQDSNLDPRVQSAVTLPIGPSRNGWRPGRVHSPAAGSQRAVDAQVGAYALTARTIRASLGVLSALRWLQLVHAATVFCHVFFPPRARGTTWSTVVAGLWQ
jgi:hypothetical protein